MSCSLLLKWVSFISMVVFTPSKAKHQSKIFLAFTFVWCEYTLIGLSLIERPILISRLNLKLIQIGWKVPLPFSAFWRDTRLASCHVMQLCQTVISCIIEHLIWDLAEETPSPNPFSAFLWDTRLTSHMWNTHGPHTTNPHSDSSYLNIFFFFRPPTW